MRATFWTLCASAVLAVALGNPNRAGSLPGYDYSAALSSSGLTWDAATLDRWLTVPQRTVPEPKCHLQESPIGPAQAVVDYLRTLR